MCPRPAAKADLRIGNELGRWDPSCGSLARRAQPQRLESLKDALALRWSENVHFRYRVVETDRLPVDALGLVY